VESLASMRNCKHPTSMEFHALIFEGAKLLELGKVCVKLHERQDTLYPKSHARGAEGRTPPR
jgi:hypothetical protein